MSLATRITLLVIVLLAACGVLGGVALQRAARRSIEAELQGRLDARLAWLAGAVDVELDDGEVRMVARDEPGGGAEYWQVATADGRVLWAASAAPPAGAIGRSRALSFGAAEWPAVPGAALKPDEGPPAPAKTWQEVPLERVPPPVLAAAAATVRGIVPAGARTRTVTKKKDPAPQVTYELRGTAGGREYDVRVDAAGRVLGVEDRAADRFDDYQFNAPDQNRRLDLVLTAQTSAAALEQELGRLTRAWWTIGPVALAATGLLLALLVRGQLKPLARMAEHAARIGPSNVSEPIGPAGSSSEAVRLRQAINSMLARLAGALDRERRFASVAAHELRTPLAQMRTTLDVALRRERDAPEYREALREISTDVARLEQLVLGLLQLTRSPDVARRRGGPVALDHILRKSAERSGAGVRFANGAGDGVWVYGDGDLLRAAFGNVFENAARYAPVEPPTVRVEPAGGQVRVVVADRGPGVPEAERERIFEPLTRLDPARTVGAAPEGFGLGLATARAAARAFGGDLSCRGRADGAPGAEFIFTLRRSDAPEGEAAAALEASNANLSSL